jgi:drug/metabolite transporter (DMT)-like permease
MPVVGAERDGRPCRAHGSEMATATAPDLSGRNPLRGILLKVVSVAVFVAMASFIKAAGQVPAGQIVFFRSFFAIFPILLVLSFRHELRGAFSTSRPGSHVVRGLVGVTAMSLGFFALTRLPLPEAVTLNYAQPLLVVVFSAIFMGETIRIFRWSAVAVGLVGVIIISWPNLTLFTSGDGLTNDQALGVMAALARRRSRRSRCCSCAGWWPWSVPPPSCCGFP